MVIVSYDSLQREPDELLELNPQVVVLDEAHYIKNGKVCHRALVGTLAPWTNALRVALTETHVCNSIPFAAARPPRPARPSARRPPCRSSSAPGGRCC